MPISEGAMALLKQLQLQTPMAPLPAAPNNIMSGPILPSTPPTDSSWFRQDGSPKGQGFLGVLARPDGGVMSEYSIADSERLKTPTGQYQDYPSLVPTLTPQEIQSLLVSRPDTPIVPSIKDKAEAYALKRLSENKPVFARTGERPYRGTK